VATKKGRLGERPFVLAGVGISQREHTGSYNYGRLLNS
jgi:hypothetical protein